MVIRCVAIFRKSLYMAATKRTNEMNSTRNETSGAKGRFVVCLYVWGQIARVMF